MTSVLSFKKLCFGVVAVGSLLSTQVAHAQYCVPIYDFSSPCSLNNIKNFILPGDVGTGINNVGSSCPSNGYSDFSSSMSVTLSKGYPYTGTISTDYDKTNFSRFSFARVWIDYDKDGKFEDI